MRRPRVWVGVALLVLVVATVPAIYLEPSGIVRGVLAGEPFYRERPLRYWREFLLTAGRSGEVTSTTRAQFWDMHHALPVIRECARDPDRNVRWVAVTILGRHDLRSAQALEVLVNALEDEDAEVRLRAAVYLTTWGPMARPASPALVARLQDPEFQVAHAADLALWLVNEPAAVAACDFRPLRPKELGFTAMLPGEPDWEERQIEDRTVAVHFIHQWHRVGPHQMPTSYSVIVAEYPGTTLEDLSDEQRIQVLKHVTPSLVDGKLKIVGEKKVVLGQMEGREYEMEMEGLDGRLWNRCFWVGRRFYKVTVAARPGLLNERAAAYFLDSFRVEAQPGDPEKRDPKRSPEP